MLPGPVMTSTFGTVAVPYAIAAIALAPPILKAVLMPQRCIAARSRGFTLPPGAGVQTTISFTPATIAGIAFMRSELGYAALPPGI